MAKLPDQSFDYDLPLMRLARDWTKLAAEDHLGGQFVDLGKYRQDMQKCLLDNSILGYIASGPPKDGGGDRIQGDLVAFEDLVRLAGLSRITMSLPATVLTELASSKFPPEKQARIENVCRRVRIKVQTETLRLTIGQRTYGVFHGHESVDTSRPEEWLQELLEPEKDPSIPSEDYEHYLMASLGQQPFLSMDYRLVQKMSRALTRQVEVAEGKVKGKSIPKLRPPLKAPVLTPTIYLKQMIRANPAWQHQLSLARTEPDSSVCYTLRMKLTAIGQGLADVLQGQGTGSEEEQSLRVEWTRLEQKLQSNQCHLGFFSDWPEECQPDRWKKLDKPQTEETI